MDASTGPTIHWNRSTEASKVSLALSLSLSLCTPECVSELFAVSGQNNEESSMNSVLSDWGRKLERRLNEPFDEETKIKNRCDC